MRSLAVTPTCLADDGAQVSLGETYTVGIVAASVGPKCRI